jgi:hypothetical protein
MVWLGQVGSGLVGSGLVRLGQVGSGWFWCGMVESDRGWFGWLILIGQEDSYGHGNSASI